MQSYQDIKYKLTENTRTNFQNYQKLLIQISEVKVPQQYLRVVIGLRCRPIRSQIREVAGRKGRDKPVLRDFKQ